MAYICLYMDYKPRIRLVRCTSPVPSYKSQPSRTVASDSAPEAAECNDLSSSWLEAASLDSKTSWETRKAAFYGGTPFNLLRIV